MTKEQREQSLSNARRACEWLTRYLCTAGSINATLKGQAVYLIAGFELLDNKEQYQREQGKKGAKYGKKGGRPKEKGEK